jgi:uracil-DNA glycosylase family 4
MARDGRQRQRFLELAGRAGACTICPDLCERRAVLSPLNGNLRPRVLFIGEAPGRQGADRTRIPLTGDISGLNFDRFIGSIGLGREDIFITNAALCNPRSATGANRKPTTTEVANCSAFLREQIALLQPPVVVTLGAVSLAALKRIEYHSFTLSNSVGRIHDWYGRKLVPVYHPSPQVLASHRREAAQLADYRTIAEALEQAAIGSAPAIRLRSKGTT